MDGFLKKKEKDSFEKAMKVKADTKLDYNLKMASELRQRSILN